ncbi:MAG: ribosomal protein S18-alanine N-acetyltransferase, partial [Candidatus Cloacimonetes bacterium]|nr:ribosomal protein S18-alanine N-acetyltransferase [Candidatus Cloacimonadota bacterium]
SMFREEMDHQISYVLVVEDKVIGYVCAWRLLEEVDITNLGISSKFQRLGWGRILLDFLLRKLAGEGFNAVYLEVRESNEKARRFYQKMGFEETGRRIGYYNSPCEDALIMTRQLDTERKE